MLVSFKCRFLILSTFFGWMTVTGQPYQEPPIITREPQDAHVREDAQAFFICQVKGNPLPTLQWKVNGETVRQNNARYLQFTSPQGQVLSINPTRYSADHNALIVCEATNSIGTANSSAVLRIYKNSSGVPRGFPIIMQLPMINNIKKGQDVVMPCKWDGDPMPTIHWMKDFLPVDTSTDQSHYQLLSEGRLRISNATYNDKGKYVCIVRNIHGSTVSEEISLFVGVPSKPSSVQIKSLGPKKLQLFWSAPEIEDLRDLIRYELEVSDNSKRQIKNISIPGNKTDYLLTDLTPNTVYKLKLAAVNNIGKGLSSGLVIKTDEYVPESPPQNISVVALNASILRVCWKPPDFRLANGRIIGYKLYWADAKVAQGGLELPSTFNESLGQSRDIPESTRNCYNITNLQPNTNYKIWLRAKTIIGEGVVSLAISQQTNGSVPSAPRRFQLSTASVEFNGRFYPIITANWQAPEMVHGELKNYRLTLIQVYPSELLGTDNFLQKEVGPDSLTFTTPIGLAKFGATYNVTIAARNQIDFGDDALAQISTDDSKPTGAPQNFRIQRVGEHEVKLLWMPPKAKFQNGRIIFYEVRHNTIPLVTESETRVNTTALEVSINDLEVDQQYGFYVRAWTSAGEGPWTSALIMPAYVNLEKNGVSNAKLQPPNNIKVFRKNEHTASLSWDIGGESSGFIIFYAMKDVGNNEDLWKTKIVGPVNHAIIDNLSPNSNYVFRIKTRGQDFKLSEWSDPVVGVVLFKQNNLSIRDLRCDPIESEIKISWRAPENTENLSAYYVSLSGNVTFVDHLSKQQKLIIENREIAKIYKHPFNLLIEFIARNLHRGTTYTFNVIAQYRMDSLSSVRKTAQTNAVEITCKTPDDRPQMVDKPKPISNDPKRKEVTLAVQRANERFGVISFYQLIIVPAHFLASADAQSISMDKLFSNMKRSSSEAPYIAAYWSRARFDDLARKDKGYFQFTLGNGKQTEDSNLHGANNKPLIEGERYVAILRACVKLNLCRDSNWSDDFRITLLNQNSSGSNLKTCATFTWHVIVSIGLSLIAEQVKM